jgi:hypothetical protein
MVEIIEVSVSSGRDASPERLMRRTTGTGAMCFSQRRARKGDGDGDGGYSELNLAC